MVCLFISLNNVDAFFFFFFCEIRLLPFNIHVYGAWEKITAAMYYLSNLETSLEQQRHISLQYDDGFPRFRICF